MTEAKYITDNNFYLGVESIPAGSVFTLEQWIECGGTEEGLKGHLSNKGNYVREWEGQTVPERFKDTQTVDDAEFVVIDQPSEDSPEEESDNEVATNNAEGDEEEESVHPTGVWNFQPDDLEPMSLEALNAFYKDHAAKFDISVRAYKDKDALIKKMCSEN